MSELCAPGPFGYSAVGPMRDRIIASRSSHVPKPRLVTETSTGSLANRTTGIGYCGKRVRLFRLVWDACISAFAGRRALYDYYFFSDPVRMAGAGAQAPEQLRDRQRLRLSAPQNPSSCPTSCASTPRTPRSCRTLSSPRCAPPNRAELLVR